MNYQMPIAPQQGWQCPCCLRVYSPMTPMCFSCPPKTVSATGTNLAINPAPNAAVPSVANFTTVRIGETKQQD